jgi:hypothetical protein
MISTVEKLPLIESEEVKFSLFFRKWYGIAWSVQRLPTGWTVPGSNPGGVEIFYTHPDQPWGPPNLLHNGYWVFPGGKVAGALY